MRDAELRKSMNKTMRALTVYDSVACSGLVTEYGYSVIAPHPTPGDPPSDDGWKRLFDCDEFRAFAETVSEEDAHQLKRDDLRRTDENMQRLQTKDFAEVHSTTPAGELDR
eukprot:6489362-Amphidinium_carterae.1